MNIDETLFCSLRLCYCTSKECVNLGGGMFGHTDNQQVNDGSQSQMAQNPIVGDDQIMHDGSLEEPSTVPEQQAGMDQIPVAPEPTPQPMANPFALPSSPAPEPATQSDFSAPSAPAPAEDTSPASDDLLDLKQKALQQLSPLVNHLDQSPEEKFKTTMMMIQASDDQALLPAAYEAAQAIPDEKAKAQALLDVVNEINYFTQSH
jgi:hypothetical protein